MKSFLNNGLRPKSVLVSLLVVFSHMGLSQVNKSTAWADSVFFSKGLNTKFIKEAYIQPPFLQADFNGDGDLDLAFLIIEKATKKNGILVIHGKTFEHFIFGAGTMWVNGSDDFEWLGLWMINKKKKAYETLLEEKSGELLEEIEIKLKRPSIYLGKVKGNKVVDGGLIYWNGTNYIWIQRS